MLRYFPLIAKNAMRNRRRSILTICSVGASLCLLGVLMAIYHAFFFTPPTPEQARRLVTRNRISLANAMPVAYRDKIATINGVRGVMIMQWFGGVYKEPKNMFARVGTEPGPRRPTGVRSDAGTGSLTAPPERNLTIAPEAG